MPKKLYEGHEYTAYLQGLGAGRKDNRSERGLMALGSMFAADRRTELNCAAWFDGFEDGQRECGLEPEDTYGPKPADSGAATRNVW